MLVFVSGKAQVTSAADENVDKGLDELCTCFNSIVNSFDPKFQSVFLQALESENGKAVIQEYMVELDSTQKYNLQVELGKKIFNPDSEFSSCGKNVAAKYKVNINTSSQEQKDYYLGKLKSREKCKVMAKMIPPSKTKQ
jgi:hypothetical protein